MKFYGGKKLYHKCCLRCLILNIKISSKTSYFSKIYVCIGFTYLFFLFVCFLKFFFFLFF